MLTRITETDTDERKRNADNQALALLSAAKQSCTKTGERLGLYTNQM